MIDSTSKEKFLTSKLFLTNNNYIACFYNSNEFQYTMIVYDNDFNQKKTEVIYQSNGNEGYDKFYFKCIHFFGETGVFNYITTNDENPISIFKFKTYIKDDNSISDTYKTLTEIKIENILFNNEGATICDIIKIEDKKFYFIGMSKNKDIIYIISIFNYEEENLSERAKEKDIQIHHMQSKGCLPALGKTTLRFCYPLSFVYQSYFSQDW